MGTVSINFNAADEISKSLESINTTISSISDSAKSIDFSSCSSFSKGISGLSSSFQSNISSVSQETNNLKLSFDYSVDEYRKAYEKSENYVASINNGDVSDSPVTKYTIDDKEEEAVRATTEFIFGYKGNVSEVKEVSKDTLGELFIQNGATQNGDIYTITVDGNTYKYNTSNNKITLNGEEVEFYSKFFVTGNTDINNVTNTITILSGRGAYDSNNGPTGNAKGELFNGVNACDNSLIIVPYGSDASKQSIASQGASAATRIGDFICGGENKNIRNSIVGYSYGGMIAYKTVSENNGLYDTILAVDTYYPSNDSRYGSCNYDSFKDIEIILVESNGDLYAKEGQAINTLKSLVNNGISKDNITVVTADSDMAYYARHILGEENVQSIYSQLDSDGRKRWYGHDGGINVIKNYGFLDYLSQ